MAANGSITTQAQSQARGVISYGQRQLDRVVPPQTRERAYNSTAQFAAEKPVLFIFLASQLLFSFLPLVLFASFLISTLVFALVAAIVFSLFWTGLALLVLIPTLCLTFGAAVLIWLWAIATLVVGRWAYGLYVANFGHGAQAADNKKNKDGKEVIFPPGGGKGYGGVDGVKQ